jgi:hypothetical protein
LGTYLSCLKVLDAPPTSFLFWSPQLYFGRSADHKTPRSPQEKSEPEIFVKFLRREVVSTHQTPKLEDHSLWAVQTASSIYSQLPSILEIVLLSASWGRAMPWWQGPT